MQVEESFVSFMLLTMRSLNPNALKAKLTPNLNELIIHSQGKFFLTSIFPYIHFAS